MSKSCFVSSTTSGFTSKVFVASSGSGFEDSFSSFASSVDGGSFAEGDVEDSSFCSPSSSVVVVSYCILL